jgi:hypothetical protein
MFDVKKFMTTQFIPREEDVPVPNLKDFFDSDQEPVWRVRGLTGQELGVCNETVERNRKGLGAAIQKMLASLAPKDMDAVTAKINDPGRVTDEMARRLEMFVFGSVSPEADMDLAIKVCKHKPSEFFRIAVAIDHLSGMGSEAKKKPKSSGRTVT